MIFRVSQKLAKKLKIPPPRPAPPQSNQFADWSAHLFTANRTHYVIVTNTSSLYSTVFYGRELANQFLNRALRAIREFMVDDGLEFIFQRLVAPATQTVRFASALNRSVTGSMNDLIYHAQMWLTEGDLSPFDQITPCGISNVAMTSIEKEAGKSVTVPATAVIMEKLAAQRIGNLQITAPEPLRL
jgi:hypothetical protein